jgi:hypothetical protein
MSEDMFGYQEIGGESDADISIESYLAGRPGSEVDGEEHDP